MVEVFLIYAKNKGVEIMFEKIKCNRCEEFVNLVKDEEGIYKIACECNNIIILNNLPKQWIKD